MEKNETIEPTNKASFLGKIMLGLCFLNLVIIVFITQFSSLIGIQIGAIGLSVITLSLVLFIPFFCSIGIIGCVYTSFRNKKFTLPNLAMTLVFLILLIMDLFWALIMTSFQH